jgi:hypothetical protein
MRLPAAVLVVAFAVWGWVGPVSAQVIRVAPVPPVVAPTPLPALQMPRIPQAAPSLPAVPLPSFNQSIPSAPVPVHAEPYSPSPPRASVSPEPATVQEDFPTQVVPPPPPPEEPPQDGGDSDDRSGSERSSAFWLLFWLGVAVFGLYLMSRRS